MLFLKTNPTGIDAEIQRLQTKLHDELLVKWGIAGNRYNAYGRAYRNIREDGYVPEVYDGSGEYHDVRFDDTLACQSFFGVSERAPYEPSQFTPVVHLIFMCNIAEVKPLIAHRADEEVRIDVQRIVASNVFGFRMIESVTGVQNVFSEYPGQDVTTMRFMDMHPYHCFRLNFNMDYSIFNC